MDSFILNNVKLYNKSSKYNLYIKNGRINKISKSSIIYPNLVQYECNGFLLFPGIFDVYCKIGNPGETFSFFESNVISFRWWYYRSVMSS